MGMIFWMVYNNVDQSRTYSSWKFRIHKIKNMILQAYIINCEKPRLEGKSFHEQYGNCFRLSIKESSKIFLKKKELNREKWYTSNRE